MHHFIGSPVPIEYDKHVSRTLSPRLFPLWPMAVVLGVLVLGSAGQECEIDHEFHPSLVRSVRLGESHLQLLDEFVVVLANEGRHLAEVQQVSRTVDLVMATQKGRQWISFKQICT